MPTPFEQQVIENTNKLNQLLEQSQNIQQFDDLPDGPQSTDMVAIKRYSEDDNQITTYKILYANLVAEITNQSFSVKNMYTVSSNSSTTTNQEIVDHINSLGFLISNNQIALLILKLKINNILYRSQFLYKPNLPGTYGNQGTQVTFDDLHEIERVKLDLQSETTIVIDLGVIPGDSIEDYINNTEQQPEWDLQADIIYLFKCVIDSSNYTYIYIGQQPKFIGQENPINTTADDFELINNQGWYWIENCWVRKEGNTDFQTIEEGDIVYYKDVEFESERITLVAWKYTGGDKDLKTSYKKFSSIS